MDKASTIALWERHLECEFATRDPEATLATMVEDAYVNHVPVLTGGIGKAQLREFSSVLVQLGLLDAAKLPIAGVESARKVLDPKLRSNELMDRRKG